MVRQKRPRLTVVLPKKVIITFMFVTSSMNCGIHNVTASLVSTLLLNCREKLLIFPSIKKLDGKIIELKEFEAF